MKHQWKAQLLTEIMKLSFEKEQKLKNRVIPILKKGKPNWDVPHTKLAVEYMRQLIRANGGNELILISTMYLHDIGYVGLLKKGHTLKDYKKVTDKHMEVGAREAERILKELRYPKKAIDKITHLVRMHDKVKELSTKEELLVMEADTLAALNTKRVKPTYIKEDYLKYLSGVEKNRVPRFITKKGKEILTKLLGEAWSYFS